MPDDAWRALLVGHVERFNRGVREGDFGPMVAGFTDDAELRFEGIPIGPFQGRAAIAAAYAAQPPTDQLDVLAARQEGGEIVADYAWRAAPGQAAGAMRITQRADRIARLVVAYGAMSDLRG